MILSKIFNKNKCNLGRVIEIDLLRGFTIIILIICHIGLELSSTNTWMYYFSDIIGSEPAAPTFMILMGISDMFSRKQNAKHYFKRGISLFLLGYILNLLRSFPMFFIGELDYFACLRGLFVNDILQFAGLTFILFGIFKSFKIPSYGVFIISIIFLILGQVLMYYPNCLNFSNNATLILNLFLPLDNDWCCFNLLTWFIYPAFGLMLGELLLRCKNKDKFYFILLLLGILGLIMLYGNIIILFPDYSKMYYGDNYYRMGLLNTLFCLLVFLFLLSFWYFINKILPNFFKKYLIHLSKNVNEIYIISWIIISMFLHLKIYYSISFNIYIILLIFLTTLIFSSLIALAFKKIKIKYSKKE